MDIISHALVGNVLKEASGAHSLRNKLIIVSFAFVADIPGLLVVYPLLGHEKGRAYWIPHDSDWVGVHAAHPYWAAIWEIPHSFFFLGLIVVPLVLWLRWPRIAIASYISHILLDLPTHTGEWVERPFYPFGMTVKGFTDAWAWPFSYWIVSWAALIAMGYFVRFLTRRKQAAAS
jgi:hypothetical protein